MKPSLHQTRRTKPLSRDLPLSRRLRNTTKGKGLVPGEGSAKLPVMVLGEAPGYYEQEQLRPFVGRAGKLLRSELLRAGINPAQVYLTNTVKFFPSGTPTEEQIESQRWILEEELEILNPAWILPVGKTAFHAVAQSYESITQARGRIYSPKISDALVFPVFHPAYILRRDDLKPVFRDDLQSFKALLDYDL